MEVNPLPNEKNLDQSKLKGFADDKINWIQKLKFVLERVENINPFRNKPCFLRVCCTSLLKTLREKL